MPHLRRRFLEKILKKSFKYSPIVGLFGHRQVGKTTLASSISERFVALDRTENLRLAEGDPESFLEENRARPLAIDECQLCPPLFPELKERVRRMPAPGQFLLTGSVRFSSRKLIRESLTGRIVSWELLPMDLAESHGRPLPATLIHLLESKTLELDLRPSSYFNEKTYLGYLSQGGLPGVFAVRDEVVRAQRFETQLETILERDLRLLIATPLGLSSLRNLLVELARVQGEPFSMADLSRRTRISVPTLRKLIAAFESLFLIRQMRTEGTERKPAYYFEDAGEAFHLLQGRVAALQEIHRFLFPHIRTQISYRPEMRVELFQFRQRGGTFIPFCLRSPKGVLGIIPSLEDNPKGPLLAGARSFLRTYPDSKVLFCNPGNQNRMLAPRIRALGLKFLV